MALGAAIIYVEVTARLEYEQMAREMQIEVDNHNSVIVFSKAEGRRAARGLLAELGEGDLCPCGVIPDGGQDAMGRCKQGFTEYMGNAYGKGGIMAFHLVESGTIQGSQCQEARPPPTTPPQSVPASEPVA